MPLQPDIVEKVRHDFSPEESGAAVDLLNESEVDERVARCIISAAKGSIEKLGRLIELAAFDFRDAIVAGEYDGSGVDMKRIRDLSVSFLIDCPEKFWICAVANAAHMRGYALSSLETRAVTEGSPQYSSDYFEGIAHFAGPHGEFSVEKWNRQWFLYTDAIDVERYLLNHPFTDETHFCERIATYLLVMRRPNEANVARIRSTLESILAADHSATVANERLSMIERPWRSIPRRLARFWTERMGS